MNLVAVILLAVAAVAGAVAWYVVEQRRSSASTTTWLTAAAIPVVLVGAATLFGLGGGQAGETLLTFARVAGVAAAVTGGGLVATSLLRLADRGTGTRAGTRAATGTGTGSHLIDDDGPVGDATANVSDPETLRGGTSIGVLERLAVAVTLLAGWPEGLALVLAVKGVGRYPELSRPVAAERFIIGTLASLLWAVATVGVVYALRS